MSRLWEESIQRWYAESATSGLEYLDLANVERPTTKQLAHNFAVIYDRVLLSSKNNIRMFKIIQEEQKLLENKIELIQKSVVELQRDIHRNKPLTRKEVHSLVTEIAAQPKLVEAQALQISEELGRKLQRVEIILEKVEKWTSS